MLRPLLLFVLAGVVSASALAQRAPVELRMDTGTFRYVEGQSLAEVYLSVGASSLAYTRAGDTFVAALPVQVTIRPVAEAAPAGAVREPVYDETLDLRVAVADTSALVPGQVFTEQVRAALAPGEYQVTAEVGAGASAPSVRVVADLDVPDYSQGPIVSSLELARRITRAASPSDAFFKNGMVVQPNPDRLFGNGLGRVTYYAEVYDLPESLGEYTLLTYLSDSSRPTQLPGTESRQSRQVRPVDVVMGAVDVGALPTGEYTLHLAVLNRANESIAEQSKRFYVINPDVAQPQRNVALSADDELLYRAMGEEELAQAVAHARVVASGTERDRIAALETDDDRRSFLLRFWRDRQDPATGQDARRLFYSRLDRVNAEFRFRNRPGYRTDRGRVFLLYGQPNNIDRQAFNADTAPFEVWTYDAIPGEGRSTFVFVDRFNSGELELIHSDVTGEVSQPNWQQVIVNQ